MKNNCIFRHFFLIMISAIAVDCNSQNKKTNQDLCSDRKPVVAGSFYPDNANALKAELDALFAHAEYVKTYDDVLAVITPHAGYVYSGKVAASGYNQVDSHKKYENIFVIASSHRVLFRGASIYNRGDYITPLGKVKVNTRLADSLIKNHDVFVFNPHAHSAEHSLEVQLPFLQHILKKDFKIVPIVTGTQELREVNAIAKALAPYFNNRNLFVISSDFSHYPNYKNALTVDKRTADAIISNSVVRVINAINENASKDIENLATSLCGWPAVLTLLTITERDPDVKVIHVDYQNSGDVSGDKKRVVGYHSIIFAKKKIQAMSENQFVINGEEKKKLLEIARFTLDEYLLNGKIPGIEKSGLTANLKKECGAFVTLHKDKALRGCIGRFVANEPLYKIVQKMAVAAATEDSRFPSVKREELIDIDLEISVLTPMRKIKNIDEIEMGRHGIYIKKGFSSGTFLPQVAIETGWTKEEFLGYCSRNKVGIGWEGWKNADIYVYEAIVFSEDDY